jgi:ubiquinol-cytochrome c reductase iron-sulfur subunit
VKRLWRAVVVLVVLLRGRRHRETDPPALTPAEIASRERGEPAGAIPPEEGAPVRREVGATARVERLVAGLLLVSAAASAAFVVVLFAGADTQALGATLAAALALLGAALGVAGTRVVPREEAIERRPELGQRDAEAAVHERLGMVGEGVSRRRLLGGAGVAAGTALAAAAAVPITALGPSVGDSIAKTPWRRGRRLVGEDGAPLRADDVPLTSFVTAFPEGADRRELGSPVVLVREDPATLRLPPGRADWAPEGILAYSKICTHAGCAIALYREPLYEPTSQPPGLACPCHYSVFDTRTGGAVVAGPAGRPLPQLPLRIGPDRELRAGGGFSGPIGPAWWGVRRT